MGSFAKVAIIGHLAVMLESLDEAAGGLLLLSMSTKMNPSGPAKNAAISIAIATLAVSGYAAGQAQPTAPRPNILFILADDLGSGDVGVFYQNQRAARKDRSVPFFTTPHLDTLARDGAKLTQHYCGAPVCAPSRASLLTGLTQGHANVRDNQFDKALADTHTVATVLKQAGYATAAFGKWGLQGKPSETANDDVEHVANGQMPSYWTGYPTRRGFDYFFGYVRHKDGHFHYPKEDGREVWENDREVSAGLDLCFTTDLFTARAKKRIVDHVTENRAEPFFIYLAYDTPHAVLHNPPCAYPPGGGLKGGVQWTGQPGAMLNTATGTKDGWMHPDFAKATWDDDHNPATPEVAWPDVQRRYANNVRRIDEGVGDLLQLLHDLKLDQSTLVVFTSDNGPSAESYLKEPYAPTFFRGYGPHDGIKRDTLEGGVRVPALVRWPDGIPAGRVNDQPSGQWDWLATFADLAGVPVPAASDGVSLLPSLTGKGQQRPGILYLEYFNNTRTPKYPDFAPAHRNQQRGQMQVVHVDGYKGLRYNVSSADDNFQIFKLAADPQEARDLGAGPELADLQARMKARALQSRKGDPSAPRPYDAALVPPVSAAPGAAPGLSWSLFEGQWPWMPEFRTLTPTRQGSSEGFGLPAGAGKAPFGVLYEGFLHAPKDGEYDFTLETDSGGMLFVHDIRVIDEPYRNPAGTFSDSVRLQAGWHPLRLYYRHAGDAEPRFAVTCQTPGGEMMALDEKTLRHDHQ